MLLCRLHHIRYICVAIKTVLHYFHSLVMNFLNECSTFHFKSIYINRVLNTRHYGHGYSIYIIIFALKFPSKTTIL